MTVYQWRLFKAHFLVAYFLVAHFFPERFANFGVEKVYTLYKSGCFFKKYFLNLWSTYNAKIICSPEEDESHLHFDKKTYIFLPRRNISTLQHYPFKPYNRLNWTILGPTCC